MTGSRIKLEQKLDIFDLKNIPFLLTQISMLNIQIFVLLNNNLIKINQE